MQQTKTYPLGAIAAGSTATFQFQFDTAFPDTEYATSVSFSSNSFTPEQTAAGIKGLQVSSMTKRSDGIDLTLSNPDAADYSGDTMVLWSSNG